MSDYIALYRKWRPVNFDDVCGQDAVTDVLKYEVKNGKISHAYLFCGSRGTGKTSCARILAKAVNCLHPVNGNPCNECEACRSIDAGTALDVIEMDAASNNGVDNVRDMKDEIAFTPAILRYRVYIIDEVHMMSGAAFNALLKTLEEPPAYVVFILATTEFNKLPTTIVSRCQRFDFRRMTSDVIIARLMKIASAEGIELTEDGARVIARAAQGGMRDAVSLLELCAGKHTLIDEKFVAENLGIGSRDSVYSLISAVLAADYSAIYDTAHLGISAIVPAACINAEKLFHFVNEGTRSKGRNDNGKKKHKRREAHKKSCCFSHNILSKTVSRESACPPWHGKVSFRPRTLYLHLQVYRTRAERPKRRILQADLRDSPPLYHRQA
mgnify:CR=1 FL=1